MSREVPRDSPWMVTLYKYMFLQESRYLADLEQLTQNLRFWEADQLDYLELILAQTRLQTARAEYENVRKILRRFQ